MFIAHGIPKSLKAPERCDMCIDHGIHQISKAPEGRHVYRVKYLAPEGRYVYSTRDTQTS